MAQLDLTIRIETQDLDEGADILNRLKGVKLDPPTWKQAIDAIGVDVQPESPEVETPPAGEKRRGRPPKAAPSAAPQPDSPASATVASITSPAETSSPSDTSETSESGSDVTKEMVDAICRDKAKPPGSMLAVQDVLKTNFKRVDGDPVMRISDIQPKDYAAVYAKLSGG